jgi:ubiquinone/menaquinone biosynthesis C-methylase UbiE
MAYNAKKENTKHILSFKEITYPCEYVIRIFKGNYPKLNFNKNSFANKKILDIGCGDGRNIVFLKRCGFKVYGGEISQKIVDKIKSNLKQECVSGIEVKVSTNDNISFPDVFFDYLLSWNACYYMQGRRNFDKYVKEFARVMKPGGYLVLSIPQKTSFIFKDSKKLTAGYQTIKNDYFGSRNGEVFRIFKDEKEIEKTFSKYFKNFVFGSIHDDCFGLNYHWHMVICQKK